MPGFVVWFTGLSGSGKSTLASMLASRLERASTHVELLDGDEVRTNLSRGLGFSREDRDISVRRVGFVAKLIARSGACAITAAISPYRQVRDEVRDAIENFVEVHVSCPMEVLTQRDPKGLYARALAGEIKNFTGVDDPYEEPLAPELVLDTSVLDPEACIERVLEKLEALGYLAKRELKRQVLPAHFERTRKPIDKRVRLDEVSAANIRLMASGLTFPLIGPMTKRELHKVRAEGRLERGLPWSLPLELEVPLELGVAVEDELQLEGRNGEAIARLYVAEIWTTRVGFVSVAGPLRRAVEADDTFAIAEPIRALVASTGEHRVGLVSLGERRDGDDALIASIIGVGLPIVEVTAEPGGVVTARRVAEHHVRVGIPLEAFSPLDRRASLGVAVRLLENLACRRALVTPEDHRAVESLAEFSVELWPFRA